MAWKYLIATFRQPEEKKVSTYCNDHHLHGFPPNIGRRPLECFAHFPGFVGCMSRMLIGEVCADGVLQESGLENLLHAIDIIMNHLRLLD